MSDTKRRTSAELAELAREWMRNPSKHHHPTSASLFKAIASKPEPLPGEETSEEITADDYDEWVYQAFLDLARRPQRFHTYPDNPALIECPRKRLLRIGEEAEGEGKPSEIFRYLMELTGGGAELPHVTSQAMHKAQKYLTIANAYRKFVAEHSGKVKNFKDLKHEFRAKREQMGVHISESTLQRALKAHDLDWSGYAIAAPRKGQRKSPKNS